MSIDGECVPVLANRKNWRVCDCANVLMQRRHSHCDVNILFPLKEWKIILRLNCVKTGNVENHKIRMPQFY